MPVNRVPSRPQTDGLLDIERLLLLLLSSRTHPGETNSSWMIKGVMDFLTSDTREAAVLRDFFVFKVVQGVTRRGS